MSQINSDKQQRQFQTLTSFCQAVYLSFHWFNDSLTCEFELAIGGFELVTHRFEHVARGFELVRGCSIITSRISGGWVSAFFVMLCDGKQGGGGGG